MDEVSQQASGVAGQSVPLQRSAAEIWFEIIKRSSLESFSAAFTQDASLEGSVLAHAVIGADGIRKVFLATRTMYDTIAFGSEAVSPGRVYLEWTGRFKGQPVSGLTVLSRDAYGLIEHVALYHRPKTQLMAFSDELARLLSP